MKHTVELTEEEVREAIMEWLSEHHEMDINTKQVSWRFRGQYDNTEFDGATINIT